MHFSKIPEDIVLKTIKNYGHVFVPAPAVSAEPPSSRVQMPLMSSADNYCSCMCTGTMGEHQLLHVGGLPPSQRLQTPVPPVLPFVT